MEQYAKKQISLYGLNQLALVILCDSGIYYDNQVGGNFCLQRSEQGVLSIVFDSTGMILQELSDYTIGKVGLTMEQADYINRILQKYRSTRMLSIDKSRIKYSAEAWIYVNIEEREKLIKEVDRNEEEIFPTYDFLGFTETKGVLTWNNSD